MEPDLLKQLKPRLEWNLSRTMYLLIKRTEKRRIGASFLSVSAISLRVANCRFTYTILNMKRGIFFPFVNSAVKAASPLWLGGTLQRAGALSTSLLSTPFRVAARKLLSTGLPTPGWLARV